VKGRRDVENTVAARADWAGVGEMKWERYALDLIALVITRTAGVSRGHFDSVQSGHALETVFPQVFPGLCPDYSLQLQATTIKAVVLAITKLNKGWRNVQYDSNFEQFPGQCK
jgi:hypothetical protein